MRLTDDLIRTALKHFGLRTKKQAIEEGLRLLIRVNRQKEIRDFRAKLKWMGNSSKTR